MKSGELAGLPRELEMFGKQKDGSDLERNQKKESRIKEKEDSGIPEKKSVLKTVGVIAEKTLTSHLS